MSVTVRLCSDEDLKRIKDVSDPYLTTVFMNKTTFSAKEIAVYPYAKRREYSIYFNTPVGDLAEPLTVYATDDAALRQFLKAEYVYNEIIGIREVKTTYRDVPL